MTSIKYIMKRYLQRRRLKRLIEELTVLKGIDLGDKKKGAWNQIFTREWNDKPSIAFLLPGMARGSGGHTSILRLGTYLVESGHEVYYISYKRARKEQMIANAGYNLKGFKGELLGPEALSAIQVDIGVATYWLSAYYLWNMDNVRYKAYFIQDYEPDFYPAGDIRVFVENTYRMGYHMISLGAWNKRRIEKEIGINADATVFPYEPSEYGVMPGWESKFQEKKVIKLCSYIKEAEKRGGVSLLMGLEELYKAAKTRGIKLKISLFGDNRKLKYPISIPHTNLGKLGKDKLRKLYNESDFGIVFSYTNISLVPLEMMACGCPVVETANGSFKDFFSSESAILVDFYPQAFAKEVMYYIEHPEERRQVAETAMNELKQKTWKEAALQFREILLRGYNGTGGLG